MTPIDRRSPAEQYRQDECHSTVGVDRLQHRFDVGAVERIDCALDRPRRSPPTSPVQYLAA